MGIGHETQKGPRSEDILEEGGGGKEKTMVNVEQEAEWALLESGGKTTTREK